MRPVNSETRSTMSHRRNFVNYATMTLSDGTVLNLTPSDFRLGGNNFTDDWTDSESFQLGTAIGKTATIILDNSDGRAEELGNNVYTTYPHGKFSQYDFYMAYFTLYVCLPNAYHYNGELRDEMIRIGKFTVTTPVANTSTIEITGVDEMYKFDASFDNCTLPFNDVADTGVSLITVLNRCCQDCGVAIGYTGFDNQNMIVKEKPEGVTYRQIVSYIAQIAGCNAKISETGALQLVSYDMSALPSGGLNGGIFDEDNPYSTGDSADGGSFNPWNTGDVYDGGDFVTGFGYHSLSQVVGTQVSTDDIHFTGVSVKYEETEAHYPSTDWEGYVLEVTENPFVASLNNEGREATIAQQLYNKISGLTIRPFSCQAVQDPTIEAGDCALVFDAKGNYYPTIITNVQFKTGGYTDVSCKAESPARQSSSYVNPAAQAVVQSKHNMIEYNKQVAHFNEIASAALGYYKTEEVDPLTGATITYLHDLATLEASTNIVKITSDGVFISDDGGQSYNSGYDISTSTLLLNLVYVHGLTSDWINTGTLNVGGLDNVDGVIHVSNRTYTETTAPYTKTVSGSDTYVAFTVGPSQINLSGTYRIFYEITNVEVGKDRVITCLVMKREWDSDTSSYVWHTVVPEYSVVNDDGEIPYDFEIDASDGNVYYWIKFDRLATTNAEFTVGTYYNKINTIVDKDGITTTNIQINGGGININNNFIVDSTGKVTAKDGEIAGLTINMSEKGWTYNGLISGTDYYFKISAYGGVTCGTLASGAWQRMDYVTSYGMLKVDYGNASGTKGFVATAVGNNTYYDPGSSYAYLIADGVHVVSDERSKEDITDLSKTVCKNLILNARPVSYKFKEGENKTHHYGFIAQEVKNLLPEDNSVIEYNSDVDRYSMNYQELIAPLVKVVQEQQSEIDALKERIKALEDIVNTK